MIMGLFGPPNIKELEAKADVVGLLKALRHKKGSARTDAVPALGRLLERRVVSVGRRIIFRALGKIGAQTEDTALRERIVALLAAALEKKEPDDVEQIIVDALDSAGWQPGTNETAAQYWIIRRQWYACVEIGKPAARPLLSALTPANADRRRAAVKALEQVVVQSKDQELHEYVVDHLVDILRNAKGEEALTVTELLGRLARCLEEATSRTSVVVALVNNLEHWDSHVRRAAANALAALYREGRLDERARQAILAQRGKMAEPHEDGNYDESYCRWEKSYGWYHVDNPFHIDKGIGVPIE
jgi:hypothetical protein